MTARVLRINERLSSSDDQSRFLRSIGGPSVRFNPISSTLNNLPNGAGSIAFLLKWNNPQSTDDLNLGGLTDNTLSAWYHGIWQKGTGVLSDDDGLPGTADSSTDIRAVYGTTPGDFYVIGVDWPSGGAALERFHRGGPISNVSWTHQDSSGNNGGNRAGPGTSLGMWRVGDLGDWGGTPETARILMDVALSAAWVGTRLSDAQWQELLTNKKTSDWYNNSAGTPTLLIEFVSLTPKDIGAAPSTFFDIFRPEMFTINAPAPEGWKFDGDGMYKHVSDSSDTTLIKNMA